MPAIRPNWQNSSHKRLIPCGSLPISPYIAFSAGLGLVNKRYPHPDHELYRLGVEMLKVKKELMRRAVMRNRGGGAGVVGGGSGTEMGGGGGGGGGGVTRARMAGRMGMVTEWLGTARA
jgi:hypothetical protein